MIETINKIEEINNIFIEVLKLKYIEDNEDYFYNEAINFYVEEKLTSKKELIAFIDKNVEDEMRTKEILNNVEDNGEKELITFNIEEKELIVFIIKNDEDNMIAKEVVKYYMKNNLVSFMKEVVKYYVEKPEEEMVKIILNLLTHESFKKLIEQVKKEDFLNLYMKHTKEFEKKFQLIFTNEMKKEFNIENAEEAVKYYMEKPEELKKLIEQHLLKKEVRERFEQYFFTS